MSDTIAEIKKFVGQGALDDMIIDQASVKYKIELWGGKTTVYVIGQESEEVYEWGRSCRYKWIAKFKYDFKWQSGYHAWAELALRDGLMIGANQSEIEEEVWEDVVGPMTRADVRANELLPQ